MESFFLLVSSLLLNLLTNRYSGEEFPMSNTTFLYEYDNSLPLKVLIHGWLVNRNHATIFPIRDGKFFKLNPTKKIVAYF
jgi:hypothetical protein